jgi:hypothetical protein
VSAAIYARLLASDLMMLALRSTYRAIVRCAHLATGETSALIRGAGTGAAAEGSAAAPRGAPQSAAGASFCNTSAPANGVAVTAVAPAASRDLPAMEVPAAVVLQARPCRACLPAGENGANSAPAAGGSGFLPQDRAHRPPTSRRPGVPAPAVGPGFLRTHVPDSIQT